MLRDLGIPLAPHLKTTRETLDKLPRNKWDELVRIGLVSAGQYDVGNGMQDHLDPLWSLQTTFYWEQTFPAKVETVVEHRYKPSVGGSSMTALGSPDVVQEKWYGDYVRKYCLDKDFLASLRRERQRAGGNYAPYSEERIEYILKTGANWSGPIKTFHLVVDKGDPDSLITFCGQAVPKTTATRFD